MKRKVMVCMDKETISSTMIKTILDSNSGLKNLEEKTNDDRIWIFEFDETRFVQALGLLGTNPNRVGSDIGYYLNGVEYWLKRLPYYQHITIDFGPGDLKRRASEDFGVGLSSLFMVDSFGINWQDISQIPQKRKISRLTPDFVAFSGEDKYIFESKGTTQPQKVSASMNKAIEQAKSSREQAVAKFGFVSYFPNSKKIFPTFMFIADPPLVGEFPIMDRWKTIMFHYKNVLKFSHFEETLPIFVDVLVQKIRVESLKEGTEEISRKSTEGSKYKRELEKLETLRDDLNKTFENESKKLAKQTFEEREFIGHHVEMKTEEQTVDIFLGVETDIIERIIDLKIENEFLKNKLLDEKERKVSIFSDGTILQAVIK